MLVVFEASWYALTHHDPNICLLISSFKESLLLEPMYDCPGSSVRYVLIDQAVVLGEKPAHYWSRSEGASFYGMFAAEEEEWEM